jgi:hypothetical protein
LLSRDIGARELMAEALEGMAWSAVAQRQPGRAVQLAGTAETLREALGVPLSPEERAGYDQAVQAMREALGIEVFATTWTQGKALSPNQAIDLALQVDARPAALSLHEATSTDGCGARGQARCHRCSTPACLQGIKKAPSR